MVVIDAGGMLTFAALYHVRIARGNYAEAAFYRHEELKLSPNPIKMGSLITLLGRIGLFELAATAVEGTVLDVYKYKLRGNPDLFISEVRANLPRSDKDDLGIFIRASEEARLGNTKEALKYYSMTRWFSKSEYKIFSLIQEGDTEAAQLLLDEWKAHYDNAEAQRLAFDYLISSLTQPIIRF
jgi:hypothetical protein